MHCAIKKAPVRAMPHGGRKKCQRKEPSPVLSCVKNAISFGEPFTKNAIFSCETVPNQSLLFR